MCICAGLEPMIACIVLRRSNHCATSIDTEMTSVQILSVTADVHHLEAGV
jgi:hypothetical protein